ncbi:isochorismatase family cysteine hydrolase [Metabacillus iocasae]|uniref:Nicotinamidase-related amidase n=1 Tax=Priestia iocasae TaxID=2291674 RepID=A0ABS2R0V7_9BACI|nr:isochorismatase family cysteine hydrolase [Metabacillus iocasae]MBM7705093.1 nicotinamidase-related amidase [Metabacillus iocasae]
MNNTKTALIIIDMINDFQFNHGNMLAEQAQVVAANILKLKQFLTTKGVPTIYVNDHYRLWKADLDKIISYCTNETSRSILEQIQPTEKDYFLIKPKHSIFYGTALNMLLAELEIETLILCGIAGNICVLFSANDAYMREYNLIIPSDCIASNVAEDNEFALKMMRNVLKANTLPHKEYMK